MKEDAKTKFPSLSCDTEETKAIRQRIQKPFSQEEFLPFFVFRPVSLYLAKYMVKKTNITANQITIFMAFLSFVAPFIVYFMEPLSAFFLSAFILYNMIYFLDVLDGEVARLRKKISALGEIFDATLWFYLPILYIVYLYKLQIYFSFDHLIIFALMSISTVVMSGILRRIYTKKEYGKNEREYYDFSTIALYALRFFMTQGGIFIIAPVVYYLGIDMVYLQIFIYFSLLLYLLNSARRFYGLVEEYRDE